MSYDKARKDYSKHELLENDCPESPETLLDLWLHEAHSDSDDANAMTLCTVGENGQPSSRIVLLRELSENGIIFYTNYDSQKGKEMELNNKVALNFFWPWVERQVRVEGVVSKVSAEISDAYFRSRPIQSQIGAIASSQSSVLNSRSELEDKVKELTERFQNTYVPRPDDWGGYIVRASQYEFWQGRPSRLHDRILYTRAGDNHWEMRRLYP